MSAPAPDPFAETTALSYPFGAAPQLGAALPVAPGVLWLRMPLPMPALNHINVWALEDGPGWTLVDTGMHTSEAMAGWEAALAGALGRRPVRRVICTHMHPDHVGLAGWLTRLHACRLWMTRLEYVTCRMLVADTGREAPPDGVRFYRAAGWDEAQLENYRARFGRFGKLVQPLPDSYRRIIEGERLEIGGRIWHAVLGRGHSPEHLCLHCPELRVLISGDQVLPRISSNVSVFPTEPDANPLDEWLESLAAVRGRVPDEVLVLPSHNEPFRGLHARLAALIAGHEERLRRVHAALERPQRAVDTFGLLFRRTVGPDLLSMATGESIAHLNCLMARGRAVSHSDPGGVVWYRQADPACGPHVA
ncbi:MAG TPA: MBL fold metallo-hydrolase [Steroidobacteraceae bacterium]|nr:MBL fold metallo-hydrolase [Steroidobacteraceae bacterium]